MKKINFSLYLLIILFLIIARPSFSIDQELRDMMDTLDAAKADFNDIEQSEVIEAVKMDEAFEQIDKVTEFVKESLENDNEESAIKALEFIEKSLAGTNSLVPQEFSSDMSQADFGTFGEEKMAVVNEITTDMKKVKEENLNDLVTGLVDISEEGLDSFGIVETLDSIGIETIDLNIAMEKKKEMETWTKEDWANSWKGDILTDDGEQIISDDEINVKVSGLEQKLQENSVSILDKKSSISELQTKIDPLSNEITDLKTQKTDLLAKYNEEILKQSSDILSTEEINKSKGLADQFNSQLGDLTNQIKTAEEQSNSLQTQVQSLNLELTNEIATKSQLQSNVSNLNNQLSINQNLFSKKELELDQLKNTNLSTKVNDLNDQLENVSLQRDFAQRDFNKALDKEVEAFQYFYSALGNIEADNYDIQAEYAVKEVEAILNPDPKQYRAFELEKYSKLAGLSQDFINNGIKAIENDDWDKQKSITKEIEKALAKNPQSFLPEGWYLTTSSDSDLNVQIAEEKAIQKAVYASIELNSMRDNVKASIQEKTKDLQKLTPLRVNVLKNAVTWDGMAEHQPLLDEIEKIVDNNENVKIQRTQIEDLNSQLKNLNITSNEITGKMLRLNQELNNGFNSAKYNINEWNKLCPNKPCSLEKRILANIGVADPKDFEEIGKKLTDLRWSDANTRQNIPGEIIQKFSDYQHSKMYGLEYITKRLDEFNNKYPQVVAADLQKEINKSEVQIQLVRSSASSQARENLVKAVEDAQTQYEQIVAEETKDLTDLENKVSRILKEIPTFEDEAELIADYDPVMLRAKLVDLTNFGNTNEVDALYAARQELAEIGLKPTSEYLTGPRWEASNIKTAAIVRSKKYSFVDDYEYINALYNDPIPITNASDRAMVEEGIREVLGGSNVVIDALNSKVESLSAELNLTEEQSKTLTADIAKLETELSSLKTSEQDIQNQISNLSNQFSAKESLIIEKQQSLSSLQDQLSPLDNKMKELKGQRAEIDTKLNNQLNTIATQIESQGQATNESNALKAQFESQISQLDQQLKDYENQNLEIGNQLTALTTELDTLESETPDISSHISKLNDELKYLVEIKADLAMTQAIKSGINVNEKIVEAVAKLENKSIVQIKGTDLMRVVDTSTLTDEAGNFEAPTGTFSRGNQVYLAGAVSREQILSISKIDETGDLNISLSKAAAEKINSGMFGLETAKGMVATDDMGKGVYTLIDPKTGRQVMDSHSGNALYGGIICDGEQCGPNSNLGRQVAAEGYVFVKQGDMDQGTMCTGGDCSFNISKEELETFNTQVETGIEASAYGYNDALAAATINTKGLIADNSISEVAGTVTKEFYSGKFNIMEDGGAEALLNKAKDAVTRLEAAKASGQRVDENILASARGQVLAEASVVEAVKAAKAAASSTTQVAAAASEAASEATKVVTAAAHEIVDGVRAQKNVVQLVSDGQGNIAVIVGRTGVNVTGNQRVVFTGLTDAAANSGWGCDNDGSHAQAAGACAEHRKAIAEAEAASGLKVNAGQR